MKYCKLTTLIVTATLVLAGGCEELASNHNPPAMMGGQHYSAPTGPSGSADESTAPVNLEYLGETAVADEHAEGDLEGRGGVNIAMQWSSKYAEVSEQLLAVERKNHQLLEQNQNLRADLTGTQEELGRTRRELDEANKLLVDLHNELDTWKKDVLSFRDEMRRAQAAQLNALQKVLTVLGGEIEEPATVSDSQAAIN